MSQKNDDKQDKQNEYGSRVEFLTLPLPPDDDVPPTGVISVTLSTQRMETIPMWEGTQVIKVVNGMMSLKVAAPSDRWIGAAAALEHEQLGDRLNQLPPQIETWLRERANKESRAKKGEKEPVYVLGWDSLRPVGSDSRAARNSYISVRQFAETMVGKRTGIHLTANDSRILSVLRNRVTVEEGGVSMDQEVPDIMISGVLGKKGTDPQEDFLVILVPSNGFAAPMTLEDLILRERTVGGKKVAPFARDGALTILDVLAPLHAEKIRAARAEQARLLEVKVDAPAAPVRKGGATIADQLKAKGKEVPVTAASADASAEPPQGATAAEQEASTAAPAAEATTGKSKAKDRRRTERTRTSRKKGAAPAAEG